LDEENRIKSNITPLNNIMAQYLPKNKEIAFCKIDVEDFEKEVLLVCLIQKYRPKIFLMESPKPGILITKLPRMGKYSFG
jgi:hypothetical protein